MNCDSGKPIDEQGVEDAFELVHEINERVRTGIWVGDCFIYNNSTWCLNYCVGGEVSINSEKDCSVTLVVEIFTALSCTTLNYFFFFFFFLKVC